MTDYLKLKVSELKELLKERDLALSGTKSELVARLTADDEKKGTDASSAADAEPANAVVAPVEPAAGNSAVTESGPANSSSAEDSSAAAPAAESSKATSESTKAAEPAEPAEPKEPEMTLAEAQQRVVEELELRVKRHKRFGTDATDTELRLKRIKQFGLSDISEAKKLANINQGLRNKRFKSGNKQVST